MAKYYTIEIKLTNIIKLFHIEIKSYFSFLIANQLFTGVVNK